MAEQSDRPRIKVVPGSSESAPFVYFDGIAAFGVLNGGIVQIELAANVIIPEGAATRTESMIVGHLRCNAIAAEMLKDALERALQMQTQSAVHPAVSTKAN